MTVADDAVPAPPSVVASLSDDERTGYPMSIGELFDYADRNAAAGKLELKYDEHLGYPLAVGVDPDVEARDDSVRIVVTRLVPGR